MKHLVIGKGEVGSAIANIFNCPAMDLEDAPELYTADILHICYGWDDDFIVETQQYIEYFNPKAVVIHSSVPIGTTRNFPLAVHSPVRGVHPHLEQGIRTFVKYVGYTNYAIAIVVAEEFDKVYIRYRLVENPENTEAGKLLSTTYYGWNIMFEKYVHKFCEENDLDFNVVYKDFTETYNLGYTELDMEHVVRPVLKHMEGKINGHCILQNCELLEDFKPAKLIYDENRKK